MFLARGLRPPSRVALAVLALTLAAACTSEREVTPAEMRAMLDKGQVAAAVIHLKQAMQKDPASAELKVLLARALLIQSQPLLAEVELRKAMESPSLREEVLPLLAKALVESRAGAKLLSEFGDAKLQDAAADSALQAAKVRASFDLGKIEQGAALLAGLLQAAPQDSQLLVLEARRFALLGKADDAIRILSALVERAPNETEALLLLADLRSATSTDDKGVLALYRKVVELDRKNLPAHSAIVTGLLRQGDVSAAEQALAEMKKANAAHLQTRFMDAQVALAKSDRKRARELAQQLQAEAPQSLSAMQLAALVEMGDGKFARAEGLLTKALLIDKNARPVRRLLADVYTRAGQPEQALAVLKPMLDAPSPDQQTLRLAADAAMLTGDTVRAGDFYARAAKSDPEDVRLRTALAVVDVARGRADEGLQSLRRLSVSQPNDSRVDLVLVDTLLRRRDFDGALKAVDAMAAKDAKAPGVDLIRGRIHLLRADWPAARQSLLRAVELHPQNYPSLAALAALDAAQGRVNEAIQRYDKFLAANPPPAVRSMALRGLAGLKFQARAPQEDVVKVLRDAVAADPESEPAAIMLVDGLLRGRQVEAALSAAQTALAKSPDSVVVLDAVGRAQMAKGELRQAATSFSKVVQQRPNNAEAHLRLAQIAHLSSDLPGAVAAYLRALSINPELDEAQADLARLAAVPANRPAVLSAVKKLQRDAPSKAYPHRIEGDIHFARRAFPEAIVAYSAGLGKEQAGRLPIRLHRALLSAGRGAEAKQVADQWRKTHPDDAAFEAHLADQAMTSKDYRTAETHYRRVIELNPAHHLALNNLAWILTQEKRSGAVQLAERAAQAAPGRAAVLDTLAHALVAEGKLDQAVTMAEQILSMEPTSAAYQLSMAQVFAGAGKKDRALAVLSAVDAGSASAEQKNRAAELRRSLSAGS